MRDWIKVAEINQGPYRLVLDWTDEDLALGDIFDDEPDYVINEMITRCQQARDTLYVARVRVFLNGVEFGSDTIGGCYARDCEPKEDMLEHRIGGHLDDMIETAMAQANERAEEMLGALKEILE